MHISPVLILALLITGCAHIQKPDTPDVNTSEGLAPQQARKLHLGLVKQMLEKGLYYAALAHLDSSPNYSRDPEAQWLRAEALRHTDRPDEARTLYLTLTDGPMAARAERGLGLLAARKGEVELARSHLEQARRLDPTDGRIYNDLGYVLLIQGDIKPARRQLATAMELGFDRQRSIRNLVLLFLASGDRMAAEHLAVREGIDPNELESLSIQADSIRHAWSTAVNKS